MSTETPGRPPAGTDGPGAGPVDPDAPTDVLRVVPAGPGAPNPRPPSSPVSPSSPAPSSAGPARVASPGVGSGSGLDAGSRSDAGSGSAAGSGSDGDDAPDRRNGMGTPALALGLLAAGTCWTGWAGVVLGLFGAAAGYLGARRAWRGLATDGASSLGGFVLGAIGLVVGAVVVWPTLFGTGNFGDGLTLDQCLAASTTAKEMHMCKSQHLAEFNQRFPNAAE